MNIMPFTEVFPDITTPPWPETEVLSIRVQKETGHMTVCVRSRKAPDELSSKLVRESLAQRFGMSEVTLSLEVYDISWLAGWISERFPASNGYFHEAEFHEGDGALTIKLSQSAPAELTGLWRAAIEKELYDRGAAAKVVIAVPDAESQRKAEEAFLEEREKKAAAHVRVVKKERIKEAVSLYGRAFSQKHTPMNQLPRGEGDVCVLGEVFAVEKKETRSGGLNLFIDITDFTDSLRIKIFLPPGEQEADVTRIKPGDFLHVRGKMQADKFSRDGQLLLLPTGIQEAKKPQRPDTAEEKRVELHLHTTMSAMDATTNAEKAIKRAADWGHKAVAITDHGVLHAYPAAMSAGRKHGIKVLYGCEGYLADDPGADEEKQDGPGKTRGRSHHIIILVKNQTGLRNLYKLVSDAHIEDFYYHSSILKSKLERLREGLLLGSACEAGVLFRAVADGAPREKLLEIAKFYDFLEIQPVCNNAFMISSGKAADREALREFNRVVVGIGRELDLPVVATGDVHFLDPEDEIYRKILLSAKAMGDDNPLPLYFKTTQEMLEEFSYLGEEKAKEVVITNPGIIADLCGDVQPVRSGEYFPELAGSAEELRRLSLDRAEELYGVVWPDILTERLKKELDSIITKGYDIIYMTAQKLVSRSLECGYLVGSRGSVGSSIVAYLAGITEVNALPPHYRCPSCKNWEFPENLTVQCGVDMEDKLCPKCGKPFYKDGFDIPFATFLGFEADKKPDIDLNFSGEYQALAHQHTIEMFGSDKVFRAGTISEVKEKTAIGHVKKYAEQRQLELSAVEERRLAKGCSGVKRTTGQHPGGLIIVPQDYEIYDFCPVQHPADNKDSSIVTTHFDFHSIEENLLKLDLLGHDDPSMIRMLENLTGVDAKSIPLDDPETMSIFTDSAILGYENDAVLGFTGACAVPEFGTKFVRDMLVATNPQTFDELIRISGLSHGTNVWRGNQEDLVKSGQATLKTIICARDDIMIYLISKGLERKLAFTIMESVRKGKGLKQEWESAMRDNSVPEWYITSCKKIEYMFPKAHAVAYVIMAFRIAWFKVHHPLAFYAAFFTIRAVGFDAQLMTLGIERVTSSMNSTRKKELRTQKDEDLLVTLEVCYEFYRRGFDFKPVSLYESDPVSFTVCGSGLRPPFTALSGLGETAAESIVNARGGQGFLSVEELRMQCGGKLSSTHIDALRDIGAFNGLPESAQLNLFDM